MDKHTSMTVLVRLNATLRKHAPGYDPFTGLEVEIRSGEKVSDLLARLNVPAEEVNIIMVNGLQASLDATLNHGDRVGLFPALGGG